MSPVLFVALAFKKTNRELWNEYDVVEAMSRQISEKVQEAIDEDMYHGNHDL